VIGRGQIESECLHMLGRRELDLCYCNVRIRCDRNINTFDICGYVASPWFCLPEVPAAVGCK
jgi:hypothetical protein